MDNLTYNYYANSNRLESVVDAQQDNTGFSMKAPSYSYNYDANGNLKNDPNKEITNIEYNYLNLPTSIAFEDDSNGDTRSITYIYDANGVKLEKVVTINNNATSTQYAGNFIYQKVGSNPEEFEFFSHPEGYVTQDGLGNYEYVYQYKDHLGNVRLSYADSDNNGSINASTEIISENNYYPFGLQHKGYNNFSSANANDIAEKKGFQNQYKDDEFNLNWYTFKYRNYDPSLARFHNVDPLAAEYAYQSPYNFSENRVIDGVELEGLEYLDYRKMFEKGRKLVSDGIKGIISNNTVDEAKRQMEKSKTTDSQKIERLESEKTLNNINSFEQIKRGSKLTLKGGTVIGGESLQNDFEFINDIGFALAPFTAGTSLEVSAALEYSLQSIGSTMKISVFYIDNDYKAVSDELKSLGSYVLESKALSKVGGEIKNRYGREVANFAESMLGEVLDKLNEEEK